LPKFDVWNPNLNPPISLPLFQVFDWFEPHASFRLWYGLSILCYSVTIFLLVRRYSRPNWVIPTLWALALAGFWDTLILGQIYLPLVLATVGAWLLIERDRPVVAGLLIGLVTAFKPNFLVWPVLLLLAGHTVPAMMAFLTFGVLGCVPLLVYGPEVYQQWFALLATERDRAALTTNASFLGLSLRLGSALPGTLLSVALLGASAFWAWRYRPMALRVSALALVVGILASPLGWIHYTLFLLPVFFWGPKSLPMCLAAALLILPADRIVRLFNAPIWLMVSVGSAYNWAVLLCLIGLLRRQVATDDQALPPIAVTTD